MHFHPLSVSRHEHVWTSIVHPPCRTSYCVVCQADIAETQELAAALRASAEKPLPMLWLWIAEGVEEEARRRAGRFNEQPP